MIDETGDGVTERGVITSSDRDWVIARERAQVIAALARRDLVGHEAADEAAGALGLSQRQVYTLLARWRAGDGVVSDLLPRHSGGGRGRGRVPDDVETV